mmetsp:Transcript_111773/g.315701  ORF Transcript_111773/g.315701 Transcript_111773/m.315701 type:complete len:205 (-) Transcript_111773:90-704(-)
MPSQDRSALGTRRARPPRRSLVPPSRGPNVAALAHHRASASLCQPALRARYPNVGVPLRIVLGGARVPPLSPRLGSRVSSRPPNAHEGPQAGENQRAHVNRRSRSPCGRPQAASVRSGAAPPLRTPRFDARVTASPGSDRPCKGRRCVPCPRISGGTAGRRSEGGPDHRFFWPSSHCVLELGLGPAVSPTPRLPAPLVFPATRS